MTKTINARPPEQPADGDEWGERLGCGGVVWWKWESIFSDGDAPFTWVYQYDTVQTHGSEDDAD